MKNQDSDVNPFLPTHRLRITKRKRAEMLDEKE